MPRDDRRPWARAAPATSLPGMTSTAPSLALALLSGLVALLGLVADGSPGVVAVGLLGVLAAGLITYQDMETVTR